MRCQFCGKRRPVGYWDDYKNIERKGSKIYLDRRSICKLCLLEKGVRID